MVHKLFSHSWKIPAILINHHQCKACWKCLDACPQKVLGKVNFLWHKHAKMSHPDKCIGCLKCVKTCPHGAIIPISKIKNH
ncbi:MAG: 4Fe-4S binding protein [Bacteroidales bacterium]|nr:4Fe-4S binding protein [Bacteroidales bacterium]